jgi:hypothetical protein
VDDENTSEKNDLGEELQRKQKRKGESSAGTLSRNGRVLEPT